MPKLQNRTTLQVALQTVTGVPEAVLGTDAINTFDLSFAYENAAQVEVTQLRASSLATNLQGHNVLVASHRLSLVCT